MRTETCPSLVKMLLARCDEASLYACQSYCSFPWVLRRVLKRMTGQIAGRWCFVNVLMTTTDIGCCRQEEGLALDFACCLCTGQDGLINIGTDRKVLEQRFLGGGPDWKLSCGPDLVHGPDVPNFAFEILLLL